VIGCGCDVIGCGGDVIGCGGDVIGCGGGCVCANVYRDKGRFGVDGIEGIPGSIVSLTCNTVFSTSSSRAHPLKRLVGVLLLVNIVAV